MQLPSNMIHKAFSEIDVNEAGDKLEVCYSAMVDLAGDMAEGWQTGIAIDASTSMNNAFGKGLKGSVPEDIKKKYKKKGWILTRKQDGRTVHYWKEEAYEDAFKKGYLKTTSNIVEPEARKFSSYLAEQLDAEGRTNTIYWACGKDGKGIEELGVLDYKSCLTMGFKGPKNINFGEGTHLLPAVEYFEKKYRTAKRGLFIFITDGYLEDLDALKDFTRSLAKEIESGKRNLFKAILIGVSDDIDENQMIELDDLDTGADIDIWDHKIAHEMKDVLEIFSELVDENMVIAPFGTIYDSDGKVVKKFTDGMPARGYFELPKGSTHFTLEVKGQTIKQNLVSR